MLDLLLTDETNPRSVIFQLSALVEHIEALPQPDAAGPAHARSSASPCRVADRAAAGRRRARWPRSDDAAARPALDALLARLAAQHPGAVGLAVDRYLSHATVSRHLGARRRARRPDRRARRRRRRRAVKLRVVHRTTYVYGEPVSTSHHEAPPGPARRRGPAHAGPRRHHHARRRSRGASASTTSATAPLHFSLREPHRALEVVATSVVELHAGAGRRCCRRHAALGDGARSAARAIAAATCSTPTRSTFDSPHGQGQRRRCATTPRRRSRPAGPLLEAVRDLTRAHPRRLHLRHRGHRRVDPAGRGAARGAAASARTSPTCRSPACARSGCPPATSAATC